MDYDTEEIKVKKRVEMKNGQKIVVYYNETKIVGTESYMRRYQKNEVWKYFDIKRVLRYQVNFKNDKFFGEYKIFDAGELVFESNIIKDSDLIKWYTKSEKLVESRNHEDFGRNNE
jgi:antitoxin component YwqK of YwqJK toxin-antitoxin module